MAKIFIDIIKYIQFSVLRSISTISTATKFSFYHKQTQLVYAFRNKIFFSRNDEKDFYYKNGFFKFCNKDTELLAKEISNKIKILEKNFNGNFWKLNGRPNIDNLRENFPEVDKLFLKKIKKTINNILCSEFKVFYMVLNKNVGTKTDRTGSQLWHNDGGPSTCINVMMYLDNVTTVTGPLEIIKWDYSKRLYWYERRNLKHKRNSFSKEEYRLYRSNMFDKIIKNWKQESYEICTGKQGTIILFSNNTYHRGGYPKLGNERKAIIFHLYPSKQPLKEILKKYKNFDKQSSLPEFANFNEI